MDMINLKDRQRIVTTRSDDHYSKSNMIMLRSQTTNNKNPDPNPKEHSWSYIYNRNNQSSTSDQNQEDYMTNVDPFLWPPRCYTCSFCKREFRLAQALGGHMNVHRKDRARLTHLMHPPRSNNNITQYRSSTSLNLNLNYNPNPNESPNFSPPSTLCSLIAKPSLSYAQYSDDISIERKKWLGSEEQQESLTSIRLELEIGPVRGNEPEIRQDLDLELRLGCSK